MTSWMPQRHCAWGGCPINPPGGDYYCGEHLPMANAKSCGADLSAGDHSRRLTDEEVTTIRRRMARLENPKDIARDFGVAKQTVLYVMKHRRAS